jgi:hypothetical protein
VGLATIAPRGRAIISAAAIPKETCQNFWREAFQTSTYLDGLVLIEVDGVLKTCEHWEAMKKNANGQYRVRITAQGFLHEDEIHYFSHSTAAPVANELWKAQVIDVKGAFLKRQFIDGEDLYLRIPQGFENYYDKNDVLQFKLTIYGLKQVPFAFWKELLQAFKNVRFKRSSSDQCLSFKNTKKGLVIGILWVDSCLLMGHKSEVSKYHAVMNSYFDCDNIGDLMEYVGCKIKKQERGNHLLITQPVIMRSFIDEFAIQEDIKIEIPASRSDSFSPIQRRR